MAPRAVRRGCARRPRPTSPAPGSDTRSAAASPTRPPRARPKEWSGSSCSTRRSGSRRTSGLRAAEKARADRSYVSFAEGIDRRYEESVLTTAPRELVEAELGEHLLPDDDGRFRYRYCQSAVVAAYGEMTREPPPFERVRIPTLLVLGETSYLPYDWLLDAHSAALGDLLQVVRIPAGHTLLWDAFDETAAAIEAFLAAWA